MPMAGTTSRAFIFRVTSASAVTVVVSRPNTRRKLVGMVAPAVSVIVSAVSSTVIEGPLTAAPLWPGGKMAEHRGLGVLGLGLRCRLGVYLLPLSISVTPLRAREAVF